MFSFIGHGLAAAVGMPCAPLCVFCAADRVLKIQKLRLEVESTMIWFERRVHMYGLCGLTVHEAAELFMLGRGFQVWADHAKEWEMTGIEFRPAAFVPMFQVRPGSTGKSSA